MSLPRIAADGCCSIMLKQCPAEIARELLNPAVPYIWIPGHRPNRYFEWSEEELSLFKGLPPQKMLVRGLNYELILRTEEFLPVADRFDGLALFQLNQLPPGSLSIDRLKENSIDRVLRQFGLMAHYYQPHAYEVTMYRTWDPEWMQRVLAKESIASLAF